MKKEIINVFIIFVVGILIAYIFNVALTYGNLIETSISKETWLGFWGSYCGGLFAIIIGYLAIVHSNKNSEKAINQQYRLLKHQQREKQLDEYNQCLRNNLELLNAVDVLGITVSINYDNLSITKAEIIKRRSLIFSCDLQYRYIFEVDSNNHKTEIEEKYNKCWSESLAILSDLLDKQLKFVMRIGQNINETKLKKNNHSIISALQRILELSTNEEEITKCQEEINDTCKELEELESHIQAYNKDIDIMTAELKRLMDLLLIKTKDLFDLSIKLMKEKRAVSV